MIAIEAKGLRKSFGRPGWRAAAQRGAGQRGASQCHKGR